MTYQLSTIVTEVQQRVADTSYSPSEIAGYVNDTQNDIFNEYRLELMKASDDFTATIGDSDITSGVGLPADYVEPISLRNVTTGQNLDIPFIDLDDLELQYPGYDTAENGAPEYAYLDGTSLRLYPAPDFAYTLRLRYYKRPTELEDDADVPQVPIEFKELLVVGAIYRVLQVKQAYDEAGIYENKYGELLQKFFDKYLRAPASGPAIMGINRTNDRRASRKIDSYYRVP